MKLFEETFLTMGPMELSHISLRERERESSGLDRKKKKSIISSKNERKPKEEADPPPKRRIQWLLIKEERYIGGPKIDSYSNSQQCFLPQIKKKERMINKSPNYIDCCTYYIVCVLGCW